MDSCFRLTGPKHTIESTSTGCLTYSGNTAFHQTSSQSWKGASTIELLQYQSTKTRHTYKSVKESLKVTPLLRSSMSWHSNQCSLQPRQKLLESQTAMGE